MTLNQLAREHVLEKNGIRPELVEQFDELDFAVEGRFGEEAKRFMEGYKMALFRMMADEQIRKEIIHE